MTRYPILEGFAYLRRAIASLRAAETKDLEFGHNQMTILYKLSLAPANMGELVDFTYSDKASVTRTVSSLEKLGLVKRKSDTNDRRARIIELTAKGRTHAEKVHAIRDSLGKKLDSCLSPDERKQFSALVHKIVENLK
jgi:DNA-binding MarR family transcriptional regulator